MNKAVRGFTIVELLIVIVVIGILAAIVTVAYQGVSARADTASRLSEMKAWQKLYQTYAALNGKYPPYTGSPDGDSDKGYCLGTGYPDVDSDGLQDCRDLYGSTYQFHPNTELNNELKTVGSLPNGIRTSPGSNSIGPYAMYYSGGNVIITDTFKGSTCPAGTDYSYAYTDGKAILCKIDLPPV